MEASHNNGGLESDPFLSFTDHARSVLTSDQAGTTGDEENERGPGWSWVASRLLKTCTSYSSGVTPAILLSELHEAWGVQQKARAPKKRMEIMNLLKRENRVKKLPHTVTIDSIHEKNFLSLDSVLQVVIVDVFLLPGTKIFMLKLGDIWSSNTIELYLHRRFYDLADNSSGILKKGREILLSGCYLRSPNKGCGLPRLLPTEYLVVLLDDAANDEAMLVAAQYCSDTFSSVTIGEAGSDVLYLLYARILSIGPIESGEHFNGVKRRKITLEENDGSTMNFFLWGEQVILANMLSVGGMLVLDKPYVGRCALNSSDITGELCLEYGSATHLFMVPYVQVEEQISVIGSSSQGIQISQVKLLCDSQGVIDYSDYPVRMLVSDLSDKMTCISLYGSVVNIVRDRSSAVLFSLTIKDLTGEICIKLQFREKWTLGRVAIGHIIFLSGLSCYKAKDGSLNLSWYDNDPKVSFVNVSCLPAMLNSSCLHEVVRLCDLNPDSNCLQVCRVQLDHINQCRIDIRSVHSCCGQVVDKECSFCRCSCDSELLQSFLLELPVSDETSKLSAWCLGETASELLQISPYEFSDLSEDEQLMYPCSLESEMFVVCLVNSKQLTMEGDSVKWEITRAQRHDF